MYKFTLARSSHLLSKDNALRLYRRTSVSREYVNTEFNRRRISVIVHRSPSDKLAINSLILLVFAPSLIPLKREKECLANCFLANSPSVYIFNNYSSKSR